MPFSFEDAGPPPEKKSFSFEEARTPPPVPQEPSTSAGGVAGAITRGIAPYAAGAAIGGAIGGPPGALAGAGIVAGGQLATELYDPVARALGLPRVMTPQEASDKALDVLGVKRPQTSIEREVQATSGAAADAASGAGLARGAVGVLKGTAKGVAERLAERPAGQAAAGAASGAAAQAAAEVGAPPVVQSLAGMAAGGIGVGTSAYRNAGINASPMAKRAIQAGFVLPPYEAEEGHIGTLNPANIAAGEAGKIKTGQLSAAKNQPVVNYFMKDELGVDQRALLTPDTFKAVRNREGQTFREVSAAVPEVDLKLDPQFVAEAEHVGAPSAKTEELFPSTIEPPAVKDLRAELLTHARGDTQAVMNYIADLRSKATANFQAVGEGAAAAHRTGAAQREAAISLEDAMERSVKNAPKYYREKLNQAIAARGEATADFTYANASAGYMPTSDIGAKIQDAMDRVLKANQAVKEWQTRLDNADARNADNQTLVERFRDARRKMAQSYDVESVTNPSTGDVSATGLGRLLMQGKPLTGNLKMVADFANSFHRAFQNPAAFGGVEPLSVLDMAAAGAMALHGHPLAAAAIPGRALMRSRVLSPVYQRSIISGQLGIPPLPIILDPGGMSTVPNELGIQ